MKHSIKINPQKDEVSLIVDTKGRQTETRTYIVFRDGEMIVYDGAYIRRIERNPTNDEAEQRRENELPYSSQAEASR